MRMLCGRRDHSRHLDLDGGRVAPDEVAPHQAVQAARDPGLRAGALARASKLAEVRARALELVLDQVAGLVALARGDAAHDADARLQMHGQVVGGAADGLVHVDREPDGVGGGARRVRHQADHRARRVVRGCAERGRRLRPGPGAAALERDLAERRLAAARRAARCAPAPSASRSASRPCRRSVTIATWRTSRPARSRRRWRAERPRPVPPSDRRRSAVRSRRAHRALACGARAARARPASRSASSRRELARDEAPITSPSTWASTSSCWSSSTRVMAPAKSRAVWKRSSGSLRQRAHHDRFELARELAHERARRLDAAGAHELEQLLALARAVQRAPGRAARGSTTPSEKMSVRRSTFSPRACSGDMYADLALEHARLFAKHVGAGDAEVGDLHRAVEAEQDVLRRHVAVHDVERLARLVRALVRVVQPVRDLAHDVGGDVGREALVRLARATHELAEVRPLDVLHAEELALVAVVLKIVDLDDVRMVQARRELRLVGEHGAEASRRAVLRQDALDDEQLVGALGAALLGEEHLGHAARPEAPDDLEIGEMARNAGSRSRSCRRAARRACHFGTDSPNRQLRSEARDSRGRVRLFGPSPAWRRVADCGRLVAHGTETLEHPCAVRRESARRRRARPGPASAPEH